MSRPVVSSLYSCLWSASLLGLVLLSGSLRAGDDRPESIRSLFRQVCLDCHDSDDPEGGLDLSALPFPGEGPSQDLSHWVRIHDRVRDREMPPDDYVELEDEEIAPFLAALGSSIRKVQAARIERAGRAKLRRLNRFEYENALRQALDAPWLQVADRLPEDGTAHLFNEVGERLDVSHIQIQKTLDTAEYALRAALRAAAHPSKTRKFYAREDPGMTRNFWYRFGQTAATRATIPLLGTRAQPEVIRKEIPVTVGESDPETREREAVGVVCGTYTATTKYDFTRAYVPVEGRYRIRLKTYTFRAAPGGRSGGKDHGLTTGRAAWWRPDRNRALPGDRTEPITLYALARSGDSRWLATYDATPEPSVTEHVVDLRARETIRPDAGRLVRTRPGWSGNPHATRDGIPGFALCWLEVEGPVVESWPPPSYRALFDELPFEVNESGEVEVQTDRPDEEARRLLERFYRKALSRPPESPDDLEPFLAVYHQTREEGAPFTEAMIPAFMAILASPDFLILETRPGPLPPRAVAERLAYFLWNSPPDSVLTDLAREGQLLEGEALEEEVGRLIHDPRFDRFVEAFLDYWLDLRELQANAPDATLYPDYYLDDQLTEASLFETRLFFRTLVRENHPVTALIDADFAYVNERLALHYDLEAREGVELRRVKLPPDSIRGGLLTQASVSRVTANGTTTSPVLRGVWIARRILGLDIPEPPSGIEAIEPDTRGATTIREQLDLHRNVASCAGCHRKFDPVGFALESLDIAGGHRERYRALGTEGDPVQGYGKNGHAFKYRLALPVDTSGELPDGQEFEGVGELRKLLVRKPRELARNLLHQFIVASTGAPVRFVDREEVERILDRIAPEYRIQTMLRALVSSKLFLNK